MCLNPIHIYSRKRRLGFGDSFLHDVSCGKCSECLEARKQEYYVRTYFTFQECVDKGGYMLFDTLTYDDEYLPHVSDFVPLASGQDFSCFNVNHYKLFFKRLRISLHRLGYSNGCIKYFLSSEYGSRSIYTTCNGTRRLGTQRPHHHLLLFVLDPTLSYDVLSLAISQAWIYGRTDGIPYKSSSYVRSKRVFGRSFNDDPAFMRSVCMYVAKYVNKDPEFASELSDRISCLVLARFGKELHDHPTDEVKDYIRKLKLAMSPFSRHSNDFGTYAFSVCDLGLVHETGMLSIPDSKKVVRHFRMPMYLSRKLYYDLKEIDGRKQWRLNDLGLSVKKKRMLKSSDLFARRIEDWLASPSAIPYKDVFFSLLAGRSICQFADYVIFYRHRLFVLDSPYEVPSIDEMIRCILLQDQNIFNNYNTQVDVRLLGSKFVDSHPFSQLFVEVGGTYTRSVQDFFTDTLCQVKDNNHISDFFWKYCVCDYRNVSFSFVDPFDRFNRDVRSLNRRWKNKSFRDPLVRHDQFVNTHCYHENSFECWRDFDLLYSVYIYSLLNLNDEKERCYHFSQDMMKRLKAAGFVINDF